MKFDERQSADLSHSLIRAKLIDVYREDRLPPASHPGWPALATTLKRSWFTRLWTLQEAVVLYRGDSVICCGNQNIP
jgi:hypothetical protein